MEQFYQKGMISSIVKDASRNFSEYSSEIRGCMPQKIEEDSAKVKLKFVVNDEHPENFTVMNFMIYNLDWSHLWYMIGINEAEVVVPFGIYDIQTQTYDLNDPVQVKLLNHIDEMITINKDTTITLDVTNAPNLCSFDLYDESGELLQLDTYNGIWEMIGEGNIQGINGVGWIWLEDYGPTNNIYVMGDAQVEGLLRPGEFFINDVSNRYTFVFSLNTADKDGVFYINRLTGKSFSSLPLKNTPSDYVSYEETIKGTPKGTTLIEKPVSVLQDYVFFDNSEEYGNNIVNNTPVEDRIARVMINAPKNGEKQLKGVNMSVSLGVLDSESWTVTEYNYEDENGDPVVWVDSVRNTSFIVGPELMINEDNCVEFLVRSGVAHTPDIGVWKDDYPPHPKFSYAFNQKKGIIGNNCPLVTFDSRNGWAQWLNANRISILANHVGRNGEQIGSGDDYSTMTTKYNGDVVWSGKQALDSLSAAWAREHSDGNYEFEFTNANVAVDGIPGKNVTTVYFDQTKEDQNPPVLKMLQFRDGENNVTDRFELPEVGTIMFAGGDFDPRSTTYMTEYGYESNWDYKECQPMTVEVSYAPYGSDEWQPLEGIEHQEEYDDIPGMGFFYSGSLAGVSTPSENGWFDLKFRLVDESGNWQEQTLSPAFRVDALVQSAVSEVRDGSAHEVARYSIDGKRVNANHSGIVIVKMSDGTARKVFVP